MIICHATFNRVRGDVASVVMDADLQHWLITIDIRFRLLRVAYQWKSFLMDGILSMYHTCGKRLPLTLINVSSNDLVIKRDIPSTIFFINVNVYAIAMFK